MDHFFVTPDERLQDRWRTAIPDGVAVETVGSITDTVAPGSAVLWLDISSISPGDRAQVLIDSVATGCAVVALSNQPRESEGILALSSGALGYCHAYTPPGRLREIARVVEHGGVWLSPELMKRLLALSLRVVRVENRLKSDLAELTAREIAVAEEVAQGLSNREIAESLDISERTVKAHVSSILAKLGLRDRVQLALTVSRALSGSIVN
jgi:DNA-binding NarL/FixJ family response regulator